VLVAALLILPLGAQDEDDPSPPLSLPLLSKVLNGGGNLRLVDSTARVGVVKGGVHLLADSGRAVLLMMMLLLFSGRCRSGCTILVISSHSERRIRRAVFSYVTRLVTAGVGFGGRAGRGGPCDGDRGNGGGHDVGVIGGAAVRFISDVTEAAVGVPVANDRTRLSNGVGLELWLKGKVNDGLRLAGVLAVMLSRRLVLTATGWSDDAAAPVTTSPINTTGITASQHSQRWWQQQQSGDSSALIQRPEGMFSLRSQDSIYVMTVMIGPFTFIVPTHNPLCVLGFGETCGLVS